MSLFPDADRLRDRAQRKEQEALLSLLLRASANGRHGLEVTELYTSTIEMLKEAGYVVSKLHPDRHDYLITW